jgi:hypothetical protein
MIINPTILPNTLTETAALMVSSSFVANGFSGSLGEGVAVYMGRNNVKDRAIPNVVVFIENITYPENFNTRYVSGSTVTVKEVGMVSLNVDVEQYATDTPEDDYLSFYAFSAFDFPKQNIETLSSGSLFIYTTGQPEITETLNIDDNTWIQRCNLKLLAALT